MSQMQAGSEVKEKSIAEKAKICLPCEDVEDNEEVMSEKDVSEPGEANVEAVAGASVDAKSDATENLETTEEETSDPLAELYGETEIRVDLKVDKWDMYAFLMHHTYTSFSGIVAIFLSLFCLWQGVSALSSGEANSSAWIFILVGAWFLIINPVTMLGKAAMQIKTTTSLQKPITYVFTENGLIQEQGEARTGCRWNQITKTVWTKRIWILYVGKLRGSILPVRQLGEQADELKALIRQQTGKKR